MGATYSVGDMVNAPEPPFGAIVRVFAVAGGAKIPSEPRVFARLDDDDAGWVEASTDESQWRSWSAVLTLGQVEIAYIPPAGA